MSKYILILLLYNKFDLINECKLETLFSIEEIIKIKKKLLIILKIKTNLLDL